MGHKPQYSSLYLKVLNKLIIQIIFEKSVHSYFIWPLSLNPWFIYLLMTHIY